MRQSDEEGLGSPSLSEFNLIIYQTYNFIRGGGDALRLVVLCSLARRTSSVVATNSNGLQPNSEASNLVAVCYK